MTSEAQDRVEIFVDGDACPVKQEILRVAERHGMTVRLVSNSWHRLARHPLVRQMVVAEGTDAADDWIAENIGPGDIAVTADIPLAARCLKQGARALRPDGRPFTEGNIGITLATRDLMTRLRETGEITGGPAAFTKQDRSRFLSALEQEIQSSLRNR